MNDLLHKPNQYRLSTILLIWALSALPMALLAFVVTPWLIPILQWPPVMVYWMATIIGLIWQFVLSMLILKREGHGLNWATIRDRLRYRKPTHPVSGKQHYALLLWTLPFILLSALMQAGIGFPDLDQWTKPLWSRLPVYDMSSLADGQYKGAWWLLIPYLITMLFNYFLGEEFMYRGILLPKMNGVFGKMDWFANGILFGLYHLHKPQVILSTALLFGFIFAFPSKLFKSSWMAFIIHGLEGLLGLAIVLSVILGLS